MAEIEESLLKRKLDSYSSDLKDFSAEDELTVEITLNEYRELIKEKSISDYRVKKAEEDKYSREKANERLLKENDNLNSQLLIYKKIYGELDTLEKDNVKESEGK